MQRYLTHDLIYILIVFQAVLLLIVWSNWTILRRARQHKLPEKKPYLSVLIPARNEETNIARCVHSLLAQDYPGFEILVLDDQSDDATPEVLCRLAAHEPRLTALAGQALPEGWIGKNWACHQLARQARGELLLFTDADTVYQPNALSALVSAMDGEQADVLTGFPDQEMQTWGERLTVPFFSWAFLTFTPLALAYRLRLPSLSSGVGQALFFRRAAYDAIGGHEAVHGQIAEDLSLIRRAKAAGLRWRVTHIADLISSRMYHNGGQAIRGFAKNYFAAFEFRLLPYVFVLVWLAVMFWLPPAVLVLALLEFAPQAEIAALLACMGFSLLLWMIPYQQMGFGVGLAFLYPVTLLVSEVIAWKSLWLSITGRLSWKGRGIGRSRWRWL